MKLWLFAVMCGLLVWGCSGTPDPAVKVSGDPVDGSSGPGSGKDGVPDPPQTRPPVGDPGSEGKSLTLEDPPQQDPSQGKQDPKDPVSQGQGPDAAELQKASLVAWSKTVDEATAAATKDGGYVLLVFEAPWHTGSKIMKKEVFSDPAMAKLLQGAHPVSIDVDDPATKGLQKEHEVTAIPVLFFVKPGQKPFGMIDGYYDLGLFQKQLRKVLKSR